MTLPLFAAAHYPHPHEHLLTAVTSLFIQVVFSIAYALWNIKFASCAQVTVHSLFSLTIHSLLIQDDGTLTHIGHSHMIPLLSAVFYGGNYMEYRVGALHVHFSLAAIFSQNKVRY